MTVTINFQPRVSPGYTPRPALRLHNVASVEDVDVNMVRIHMQFSDEKPSYDHVVSVLVIPSRESL